MAGIQLPNKRNVAAVRRPGRTEIVGGIDGHAKRLIRAEPHCVNIEVVLFRAIPNESDLTGIG